jgi:hypothetical protein
MASKRGWFVALVLVLGIVAGCSSGGGGGGGTTSAQALGFAFKGAIANAAVTVSALRNTGVVGQELATGQTDSQGFFDIPVLNYTGWAVVALVGGLATDFLGNSVPIDPDFPLYGLVKLAAGSPVFYSVTVLTTLVFFALQAEMLRGAPDLDTGVANASRRIALLFGITLSLLTLLPTDLTAGPAPATEQSNYGAVTHGFCELAINLGIAEVQLMHLLGRDLLDGLLDGQFFGRSLVSTNNVTLTASVWNVLWPLAIGNFLVSSFNQSGLNSSDIPAIAALQSLVVAMALTPLIFSIHPRYVDPTQDSTVEIRGQDLPPAAEAKVTVGGQDVDPSNVADTTDGLAVTLTPAFQLGLAYDSKGKTDLIVENTTNGLFLPEREALGQLLTTDTPIITNVSPACAAAGGGTELEIEGANLHKDTTVTIGGQSATVTVDGAPSKLVVSTPALSPGTHTITVENNGQSTNAGTIQVKDKDLTASETETDNEPQFGIAIQTGFNPDKFISYYTFEYDWQNADTGTSDVTKWTIRENAPSVVTESFPGVSTFRSRCGRTETLLNSGPGINFFVKNLRNHYVRTGLGPDAIVVGWEVPTGVTRSTVAGLHYVIVQQWNFQENWRRYMSGFAEFGVDGVGSIILWCWQTDLATGDTDTDILGGAFDWDVDDKGYASWTPIGTGSFPTLQGWFDGEGRVGVAGGFDGDSLIYANSVRVGSGFGVDDAGGVWMGNRQREETIVGSTTEQQTDLSLVRSIVSCDGPWGVSLEASEQNTRRSDDTISKFSWQLDLQPYLTAGSGLQYNDQGFVIGAAYRKEDFGFQVRGGLSGNGATFGAQVYTPSWQTDRSIQGRFGGAELTSIGAGDGTSVESSIGRVALHDYAAATDPVLGGFTVKLAGERSTALKVGQTIARDLSRAVTVTPFTNTTRVPIGYTVAGRTAIEFTLGATPTIRRVGALSPSGKALLYSDSGAGLRPSKSVLFSIPSGGVTLDGDFRLGLIEKGYNLSNGDLSFAVERLSATFSGGSYSASGSRDEAFEDNTTSSGSPSLSGSYTLNTDGVTELTVGSRFFFLVPYQDGESFVGVGADASGIQTLLFGTKVQMSAPTIGNFVTLRVGYSFDDFNPFPPQYTARSGIVKEALASPGQVLLTGSIGSRTNQSPDVSIFQNFDTFGLSYNFDGSGTSTEGSSTTRPAGGSACQGFDTDAEITPRNFSLGVRIRW